MSALIYVNISLHFSLYNKINFNNRVDIKGFII